MNQALSVFKALSDGSRLRVFAVLHYKQELCACQIKELLQVTGATTSRHMAILVDAGLLLSRKEGRWVHYCLNYQNPLIKSLKSLINRDLEMNAVMQKDRESIDAIMARPPEELCRQQRDER